MVSEVGLEPNSLPSEGLNKYLHPSMKTKHEMKSRFLLDVIIGKGVGDGHASGIVRFLVTEITLKKKSENSPRIRRVRSSTHITEIQNRSPITPESERQCSEEYERG